MQTNGEAIYATEGRPAYAHPAWGRTTQKANAKGWDDAVTYTCGPGPPVANSFCRESNRPRCIRPPAGRRCGRHIRPSRRRGWFWRSRGAAPNPDVSVAALEFARPIRIDRAPAPSAQTDGMGTPVDPSGGTPAKVMRPRVRAVPLRASASPKLAVAKRPPVSLIS